jgi:hypothetical protein
MSYSEKRQQPKQKKVPSNLQNPISGGSCNVLPKLFLTFADFQNPNGGGGGDVLFTKTYQYTKSYSEGWED